MINSKTMGLSPSQGLLGLVLYIRTCACECEGAALLLLNLLVSVL